MLVESNNLSKIGWKGGLGVLDNKYWGVFMFDACRSSILPFPQSDNTTDLTASTKDAKIRVIVTQNEQKNAIGTCRSSKTSTTEIQGT